jgi:hypothetical protein
MTPARPAAGSLRVFAYGLGYFACYLPYAALTKALTSPDAIEGAVDGATLLPLATLSSAIGMAIFLGASGLYRTTVPTGKRLPRLRAGAVLSGLATAIVLVTTTLSYTFASSSVPFVMVLMRGGVLGLAPLIDAVTGRSIPPHAWAALGLSSAAVILVTVGSGGEGSISLGLGAVVGSYLVAYAVRLLAMSRMAKSPDPAAGFRFFAEEQMVATPAALVMLALLAAILPSPLGDGLRAGFTGDLPHAGWTIAVGLLSQGTGIFGALVLLDARGHASSVPINRAASIVAGLGAGVALWWGLGLAAPSAREWIACTLLVLAVAILYWFGRGGAPSSASLSPIAPGASS